jgi:aspartate carbamoyltransferase catalytic subunit
MSATIQSEQLSVEHLLGIKELTAADIELIFRTADGFKEVLNRPIKKVPSCATSRSPTFFFESSTRTRVSFELAEKRLSADVVNFSSSGSSVSKGETLVDTVNNILAMKVDMVVMRHPDPGAAVFLSRHVGARIVNAGDGTHEHPTQALLDAYSIREKLGKVRGVKVLIVGDILHSRVALSNIFCLQKLGAEVMLCGPYHVDAPAHRQSRREGGARPGQSPAVVRCGQYAADPTGAARGRWHCEFPEPARVRHALRTGPGALRSASVKKIVIMHPGPINRGVEITSQVADHANSIILDQVENGVAIRMAVLYLLAARIPRSAV